VTGASSTQLWFTGAVLDRAGLEILESDQCVALVRRAQIGRVAICADQGPLVFPVNFVVLDDSVVFRTGEGTKLDALVHGGRVAFEVDAVHSIFEEGWSVVILGTAEELIDPTEVDRTTQMGLRSWAPGSKAHVIRIRTDSISGRRIGTHN
jgi:uncharacterized protein